MLFMILCIAMPKIFCSLAADDEGKARIRLSPAEFTPAGISNLAIIVTIPGRRTQASQMPILNVVEQAFAEELLQKGYTILSRAEVDKVLKEMRFQQAGITDSGDSSELVNF